MKNIKVFIIFGAILIVVNVGVVFLSHYVDKSKEIKLKELITEAISEHYSQKPHSQKPHYDINNLKTCDICGCLIAPGREITGKKEIRKRFVQYPAGGNWYDKNGNLDNSPIVHGYDEDYIYTPYYCKIHTQKKVKK